MVRRRVEKTVDGAGHLEKGEPSVLRRAEAARKLREVPDYLPEKDERELERRQEEAEKVWQECGECRSEFAREFGIDSHQYVEDKIRQAEKARGREEGPRTFEIEKTLTDREGHEHRIDLWDHEAKAIDDIKPVEPGERVGELFEKHGDQLLRYVRVAKEKGEEVKEVGIRPYPGVKAHEVPES